MSMQRSGSRTQPVERAVVWKHKRTASWIQGHVGGGHMWLSWDHALLAL